MDVKALIRSLEACPIGDGDLYGEPFSCLPYQRKFLRGAFAPGVLRAGLSLARGGGKTGLSSGLCLDAIRPEGTLHKPGFEAVLIASSFDQARIGFEAVLNSLELMGERDDYRVLNQTNVAMLQHKRTKARLRVAGSDNRRAQGWRFNLCVGDEGAQWGPRGELLAAAIRTALGKRKDARFIAIGTRPATDSHWFARLLAEDDPAVFALSYAATADDNPFAVKTWRKANPALSYGMPSLEVLKAEARLARRDPAELATFRSMRLNMGTAEVERPYLLDAETWREVETDELPPRAGPLCLGLDLGGVRAFCGVAGFSPRTGRLEGFIACGGDPPLAERALADQVPGVYERMEEAGELVLLGNRVVPVGALLREAVRRFGRPHAIAADRWRAGELEDGAVDAKLRLPEPNWRGQGWRDGGQDVRAFRKAVLDGEVSAPVSLAMRAAFAEARTIADDAGNVKLAKSGEGKRTRGRDDLAAAIVLAVAEGVRLDVGAKPPGRRVRSAVVSAGASIPSATAETHRAETANEEARKPRRRRYRSAVVRAA